MGLFQRALETFEANLDIVGVEREGHQTLAPVGHMLTRAQVEIVIDAEGSFVSARAVGKNEGKIPIPVTEASSGRTNNLCAHPLCEQLGYVASADEKKHSLYLTQLRAWAASDCTNPFLMAILRYVEKNSILQDLTRCAVIEPNKKSSRTDIEKMMVRWRVMGLGLILDGCWQQPSLFASFQRWYAGLRTDGAPTLCMVSGQCLPAARQHPKGVIAQKGNAKLISANDKRGFTFRGRFTEDIQALSVSYEASQKAHNALHWLAAEQGARALFGERLFLCWIPQGLDICHAAGPFARNAPSCHSPSDYRRDLQKILEGYQSCLPDKASWVVLASFDAATTGRLALTYYRELLAQDFLERLRSWEEHCAWPGWNGIIQSPPLWQIVNAAFGVQLEENGRFRLKTDDKLFGQQMQRLIACRVDQSPFPRDMVQSLVNRASAPYSFEAEVWKNILRTACAVLRKDKFDRYGEDWKMDYDMESKDRSYHFGGVMAVMEKIERDTFTAGETRDAHVNKKWGEFCKHPMEAMDLVRRELEKAYYVRLRPGLRYMYERKISLLMKKINESSPETEWNAPLKPSYLMGYYLMRDSLYRSKSQTEAAGADDDEDEVDSAGQTLAVEL